jgi:hypothetical protein
MERKLEIGMGLVFIDENRKERDALVTAIHGDPEGYSYYPNEDLKALHGSDAMVTDWPCLNFVVVDDSEGSQDQYGRQVVRHTSVVHWRQSSARGFCWRFQDEEVFGEELTKTIS